MGDIILVVIDKEIEAGMEIRKNILTFKEKK